MKTDLSDFILWLNHSYDKNNNRWVINNIYNMIIGKLDSLNLKLQKNDFKNHLTAFIYQYSSGTRVNNPNNYFNEYTEEKEYFDLMYTDDIRDLFRDINEYINLYRFNILDVNNKLLELNFIDFIFQNIEVLLPQENEEDEDLEEDYYDNY